MCYNGGIRSISDLKEPYQIVITENGKRKLEVITSASKPRQSATITRPHPSHRQKRRITMKKHPYHSRARPEPLRLRHQSSIDKQKSMNSSMRWRTPATTPAMPRDTATGYRSHWTPLPRNPITKSTSESTDAQTLDTDTNLTDPEIVRDRYLPILMDDNGTWLDQNAEPIPYANSERFFSATVNTLKVAVAINSLCEELQSDFYQNQLDTISSWYRGTLRHRRASPLRVASRRNGYQLRQLSERPPRPYWQSDRLQ